MIALKLAKVWHVTPSKVLREPTDKVIAALVYERFLNQYEAKMIDLTREST